MLLVCGTTADYEKNQDFLKNQSQQRNLDKVNSLKNKKNQKTFGHNWVTGI